MVRILFMGRKLVARDCLLHLLKLDNVKVVGVLTDSHKKDSVTAAAARANNVPLFTFDEALTAMKDGSLGFDLGLSMLFWRKLREQFLTSPRLGIINFHPAPLPEYKGVGGYNLAILEGLTEWAVSAHFVDKNIDTGAIIKVNRFCIDNISETASSLEKKSQYQLKVLFDSVLEVVLNDETSIETIPNIGGKHLSRKELEAMKKVNFSQDDVDRKVRAFWFPPYDGAYIEHDGVKFSLVNRLILEELADPGVSSLFSPEVKNDSEF